MTAEAVVATPRRAETNEEAVGGGETVGFNHVVWANKSCMCLFEFLLSLIHPYAEEIFV